MPRKKYYYENGGLAEETKLSANEVYNIIVDGMRRWERQNNTSLDNFIFKSNNEPYSKAELIEQLFKIAYAESTFDPLASKTESEGPAAGATSYGLWQVLDEHFEDGMFNTFNEPKENLINATPIQNLLYALDLAAEKQDLSPWTVYEMAVNRDPMNQSESVMLGNDRLWDVATDMYAKISTIPVDSDEESGRYNPQVEIAGIERNFAPIIDDIPPSGYFGPPQQAPSRPTFGPTQEPDFIPEGSFAPPRPKIVYGPSQEAELIPEGSNNMVNVNLQDVFNPAMYPGNTNADDMENLYFEPPDQLPPTSVYSGDRLTFTPPESSGMPTKLSFDRQVKDQFLRRVLGTDVYSAIAFNELDYLRDLTKVIDTGEVNVKGHRIYQVQPPSGLPKDAIGNIIDDIASATELDKPLLTVRINDFINSADFTTKESLNPTSGLYTSSPLKSDIVGEQGLLGSNASEYIQGMLKTHDPNDVLRMQMEIVNWLDNFAQGSGRDILFDPSTKVVHSPNTNEMILTYFQRDDSGALTGGLQDALTIMAPASLGNENYGPDGYQPQVINEGIGQGFAPVLPADVPVGKWVTKVDPNKHPSEWISKFIEPDAEGKVVYPTDGNWIPMGNVPDFAPPKTTASPDTTANIEATNKRAETANEITIARDEATARNNALTQAFNRAQLAQDQAQYQASQAEAQGQFDRSLALQAFAQQSADEATRINAQLQIGQQNIARLNQITDALARPSDAVAASFALTGQQSPMGIFTQADAVNPYIADMMEQRSAIEAFGPGFSGQDFMAGQGKRRNPLTQPYTGSGALGPDDIVKIGDPDADGNVDVTYGDGSVVKESSQGVPAFEHGGHSFGNPIVVGDSSKNEENQELVMSFGNAPMVVLPLNEQQEKIMERANSSVPRAENGGLTGSGMMGGDLDQTMAMDINLDHIFTNEDDPTGALRFAQDIQLGGTGRAFDPTGQFRFALGTNPQQAVDSGPGTTAPRAGGYSTRDYAIGGQPMNQGTISSQQAAFAPTGRQARMGNPGLAGFESMYPLTQGMIQDRSDMLASPRVRQVLQGTAGEGSFRQRPTQMPFALPTPGFMRNLTGTEREFLKSNLATRNIFLDDVETAVAQRFGRTNTSQGRRSFR
jgi:hypothetical protein